jgi:NAD(P)-dependent dehydrogenase (short-subunit alcohol dehydrogenase family)
MPPDPATQWNLVTGVTAGIGAALVTRLAAEGRNVIATARDPARVRMPNVPGRVEAVRLDFEEPSPSRRRLATPRTLWAARALEASLTWRGSSSRVPSKGFRPPAALRRQFEVNVVGPVALTQALLPLIARARGAIVNIGAVSAHLTPPFYGPIAASKAALASLNDAMRLEFTPL